MQQQEKNSTDSTKKIITKLLVIKRIRKTGRVRWKYPQYYR